MKLLPYLARHSVITILSLLITALIVAGALYFYMMLQLPDVDTLKDTRLQEPLRIYSYDGQLIGEYGDMRRSPVTLQQVPKPLINAIIATEDQRFYEHPGIDPIGVVRAARELLLTGQKSQGASTITMQVARNYFLTRKKTFTRKINEMLLALKLNSTFSKDKILELYINKIYLGQRAYGVAAAAEIYYGKSLNELNLAEMAMIAGLPQAPSRDNPITNPQAAMERRNHVLQRMLEDGYITQKDYQNASVMPNTARYHGPKITLEAPYVAEMVRNVVFNQFGDAAYSSGLQVYTTIDSHMQQIANQSLRNGLLAYDQRHGYRGPEQRLGRSGNRANWQRQLQSLPVVNGLLPAAVLDVGDQSIKALLGDGQNITIPWSGISWARRATGTKYSAAAPNSAYDVVRVGDVIRVQHNDKGQWQLAQIPQIEGALISLNPNNGALLALVGGFDYGRSSFNRVIQAYRQPGSNFKPFLYAAALSKGFTLASIVNDAPVVLSSIGENSEWRPENDELKFYGPTRLRIGLIKSRNLVSVKLLQMMGIHYALNYLSNFGFDPKTLPKNLTLALGTADVTPLQMATGYAVFANGGYRVAPYFVAMIKDADGKELYQAHPLTVCSTCPISADGRVSKAPNGYPAAPMAIGADIAYLMTNALQDVIQEGTGTDAKVLNRSDIAGKTGTTNSQTNAWFSGFNRNLVTTVWVGFDQMQSTFEYGKQAALPIWVQFMGAALQGQPMATLPQPDNIVSVRIDPNTGLMAEAGQQNAVFEIFTKDTIPSQGASSSEEGTGTETQGQSGGYNANANEEAQIF